MENEIELAEELEKGMNLSHSSASDLSKLLDQDVLSLASSNPADNALLAASQKDQDVVEEGEEAGVPPSLPALNMRSFWSLWPMPQRD